jgi:pimeloyl-ACP methyl ester carboxylesterase
MSNRLAQAAVLPSQKSTNDRSVVQIPAPIRLGFKAASRISPVLGAELARQLFFRPARMAYRKEQRAVLAKAQHVTLDARGRAVRAYCWGDGPVVLLMHGWSGHAGQMTEFVKPLTTAGFRVVALDAPAHGRSAGRLSSLVHFADAMEAAASAFGPIHAVVAHSFGAAATVQAMLRGFSLDRAVFIAPQAHISTYWDIFRAALGISEPVWEVMRARSERRLKVRYDDLHPADHAPRMKTPLLILHGTTDRMTPFSEGEKLAAVWPGAQLKPLDCGHIAILRDWRALLAAVEFIKI